MSDPLNYIQSALMHEEFINITYFMATVMANGGLLVNGPMIISALLFVPAELSRRLTANPSTPVLSMSQVKKLIG